MIIYYFIYFLILIYMFKTQKRTLHMIQQNLYNENNRYLKWVFRNLNITLINMMIFATIFSIIKLFDINAFINYLSLIFIIVFCIISYFKEGKIANNNQNKKPLVYTKRIKRLLITINLLFILPIVLTILFNFNKDVCLIILCLESSLIFLVTYISNIINYPVEKAVFNYYKNSAKKKLHSMRNLKVIGITGSYGKTSSKNILNNILNIKYNCLATPKSLNTFNGLMITINNELSKFDDIFIAEMGAYVRGEIRSLCNLVEPKYGIITSIGTAHLETFGSEENIVNAKMELIESLPSTGVGVLNKDDPKQVNYKIKNNCKIIWIGINNKDADVVASNIKVSSSGTSFDVVFKNDKNKYLFETKLLGLHNVYNILAALALGREFNIDISDLQMAVRRIKPVEHRLELKKLGVINQIDDAYNSNPIGAKNALNVLNMMDGLKVVVTPGMVELGPKEYELNKEFGKQISEVADKVILIGEKKTKPIYDGLVESNYDKKNIYILKDVRESYVLLTKMKDKKEIYALFENDLPDTYNE